MPAQRHFAIRPMTLASLWQMEVTLPLPYNGRGVYAAPQDYAQPLSKRFALAALSSRPCGQQYLRDITLLQNTDSRARR